LPPVPTPSSPAKAISPFSQKSFKQRTEMTFDGRPENITGPVVQGLYCLFLQNLTKMALPEIMVNSQR